MTDPAPKKYHSSASVEWYTPPEIIERARRVFGGQIDFDPASCAEANQFVGADNFRDEAMGGITHVGPHREKILNTYSTNYSAWVNPPYGREMDDWIKASINSHLVQSATIIMLVNANTSSSWFAKLWDFPICFPSKRIRFIAKNGNPQKSPTNSNALVYMGPDGHGGYALRRKVTRLKPSAL